MYVVLLPCLTLNYQSVSFKNGWFGSVSLILIFSYSRYIIFTCICMRTCKYSLKIVIVIIITVLRWILGTWGN